MKKYCVYIYIYIYIKDYNIAQVMIELQGCEWLTNNFFWRKLYEMLIKFLIIL